MFKRADEGLLVVETYRAIQRGLRDKQTRNDRMRRALVEAGRPFSWTTFAFVGTYFSTLFVIGVLLDAGNTVFAPSLSPVGGSEHLGVLWQVQAGMVTIALPFLFVLMPLIRNEELAVTRSADLLMAHTLINPVLVFSLSGVLWVGAGALWLEHDSVMWIALFLVLLPTTLGVAFAYLRAARVIADPAYVRAASKRLLLARLDDSLIEQGAVEFANGRFVNALASESLSVLPFTPDDDDRWLIFRALRSGTLSDLRLPQLIVWLRELPRPNPPTQTPAHRIDPQAEPLELDIVPTESTDVGYWCLLIGDYIKMGSAIAVLQRDRFAEFDIKQMAAALDACLVVDENA